MEDKAIIYLGTELKLNVNIAPIGGVSMDIFDFVVEAYCTPTRSQIITKEDAIKIDKDNFIVVVKTDVVGTGDLKVKITAQLPDGDLEDDALRTEVTCVETNIKIIRNL